MFIYLSVYQCVKELCNYPFPRDCMSKVRAQKNTDGIKIHRCKVRGSCA